MRYKDWIKVGKMTNKEVLNDIELLIGALKGNYKDDTLYEDYVEIREMVTGKGSVYTITHGEFLDILYELIKHWNIDKVPADKLLPTIKPPLRSGELSKYKKHEGEE